MDNTTGMYAPVLEVFSHSVLNLVEDSGRWHAGRMAHGGDSRRHSQEFERGPAW